MPKLYPPQFFYLIPEFVCKLYANKKALMVFIP
jgi:hypothetical protein